VEEGVSGGEEAEYMPPVGNELIESVWESISDRGRGNSPGNCPVSNRSDNFLGWCGAKTDLELSDSFDLPVIVGGRVVSSENDVEVDSSASKNILPFTVRELGAIGRVSERLFVAFGVA